MITPHGHLARVLTRRGSSDPLQRWWISRDQSPVTIRRVRLTDSPVQPHAGDPMDWPYAWRVTCHAPHPQRQHPEFIDTDAGREWLWGQWKSAAAFAIDHLRRDRHPS